MVGLYKSGKRNAAKMLQLVMLLLIMQEITLAENQISAIQPTKIKLGNEEITVHHHFMLTMIDGKIFSTISDSSSIVCGICGALPGKMKKLEEIGNLPCSENLYKF